MPPLSLHRLSPLRPRSAWVRPDARRALKLDWRRSRCQVSDGFGSPHALHVVHATDGRLETSTGIDPHGRWDGGAGRELGLFPTRLHRRGLGPLGVVTRRLPYGRRCRCAAVGRVRRRFRREELGELRLERIDVGRGVVALDDGDLVAQGADLDGTIAALALGGEVGLELGLRASVESARQRGHLGDRLVLERLQLGALLQRRGLADQRLLRVFETLLPCRKVVLRSQHGQCSCRRTGSRIVSEARAIGIGTVLRFSVGCLHSSCSVVDTLWLPETS